MQTEEDQREPLGYFDNTTGCRREDMDACTASQAANSPDTLQVQYTTRCTHTSTHTNPGHTGNNNNKKHEK